MKQYDILEEVYNRKQAVPHPRSPLLNQQVTLTLQPTSTTAEYDVVAYWEERAEGLVTATVVDKVVRLDVTPKGAQLEFLLATPEARLKAPAAGALADSLGLLAGLYQTLVLRASASGRLLELVNHADVVRAWQDIKHELRRRHEEEDAMTNAIIEDFDRQVLIPQSMFDSLPYDYFYPAFVKNVYAQRFETNSTYMQRKWFPQFFPAAGLCFQETMTLHPPETPESETVTLHFRGVLDAEQTPLAEIAQALETRLASAPAIRPEELHCRYQATHELDKKTGLPVAIALTVACHCPNIYQKEYHLTVRRR